MKLPLSFAGAKLIRIIRKCAISACFILSLNISAQDWVQSGAAINGEAANDYAGDSVATSGDGNSIVIGAYGNDYPYTDVGHARVFNWNGSAWTQKGAALTGRAGSDGASLENGIAISHNGNTVILGVYRSDGGGITDRGAARVFDWNGSNWIQRGLDIIGDYFHDRAGQAVDISRDGNTVVVGAPNNDGVNGQNSGHARVFLWDGSNWIQKGLDIDGENSEDQFGRSVGIAAHGNTVVVGAPLNEYMSPDISSSGSVRVYDWVNAEWTQRGGDIDGRNSKSLLGMDVDISLDGNTIIAGAPGIDSAAPSGFAAIFHWDGKAWVQIGSDLVGESSSDNSGESVAMSYSGNTVVVGSDGNGGNGTRSGHARIFQWNGSMWIQVGTDIDGEASFDNAGRVAINGNGDTVTIGAPFNDGNGNSSGHARVFQYKGVPISTKIDIRFDYSYDVENFFSGQNEHRRGILEKVARVYEDRLEDNLNAISPEDLTPGLDSWAAEFTNPGTGEDEIIYDLYVPANTLIVYVGGHDLEEDDVGRGGGAWDLETDGNLTNSDIGSRGGGSWTGVNANEFSGWGGSMRFDDEVTWHDSDSSIVPAGSYDLYSVALHEMAHILGINSAVPSWNTLLQAHNSVSYKYVGTKGIEVFDGADDIFVETESGSHFISSTPGTIEESGIQQEVLMSDEIDPGVRKHLTNLDWAALDDLGWDVAWISTPPFPDNSAPKKSIQNSASKAALLKQVKKLKKKAKNAKRKGQAAKSKEFRKKIKKLTKQLRAL